MKILITGGSGFLGGNLTHTSSNAQHEVGYTYYKHQVQILSAHPIRLDLLDATTTKKEIKKFQPEVVFHCIGLANSDTCEIEPAVAQTINVDTTRNLVNALRGSEIRLIYISTDCLFDGKKSLYNEKDVPRPINVYAKTKLEAEKIVLQHSNSVVVRTNFYGFAIQNEKHFGHWLYSKLKNKKEVPAFKDYFFTPLMVNNLCDALLELIGHDFRGITNLSSPDRCSRFEFANEFAAQLGFSQELIKPTALEDGKLIAPRPPNCSLSNALAKSLLRTKLLPVSEGIALYKKLLELGYPEKLQSFRKK